MILQPVSAGAGSAPTVLLADCLATDSVGCAVRVMGDAVAGAYQVTKVDIDQTVAPQQAISLAVIKSKASSTRCVIQTSGVLDGVFSGLTPGKRMFVGATGQLQEGPPSYPSSGARMLQLAAFVLSSTAILIGFNSPVQLTSS
jgi:hypothetical protein